MIYSVNKSKEKQKPHPSIDSILQSSKTHPSLPIFLSYMSLKLCSFMLKKRVFNRRIQKVNEKHSSVNLSVKNQVNWKIFGDVQLVLCRKTKTPQKTGKNYKIK